MGSSKSSYTATTRNSCPLAMFAFGLIPFNGSESDETIKSCEKIICDQINRKISLEEASYNLFVLVNTDEPARLIHRVLYAFDHHKPVISCNEKQVGIRKCNLWRQEEDILLLAAIHRYGLGDWKSISHFVGNGRTRSQCSQRWGRALDPKIAKIPWSKEEDDNLLKLVQEFGPHTWAKIARNMSSRSDVQCRYRYIQLMKKEHSSHLPVLGYQEEATSNSDESAKSPAGPNALNLMLQNEINKPQRIIFMSIPALLD